MKIKLNSGEKMMLETKGANYTAYYCSLHGIQLHRNDVDSKKCGYSDCTATFKQLTDEDIDSLLVE